MGALVLFILEASMASGTFAVLQQLLSNTEMFPIVTFPMRVLGHGNGAGTMECFR